MIEIKYYPDENLIHVKRSGEVFARDLLGYMQQVDRDFAGHKTLFVLDDVRRSTSRFSAKDYGKLIEALEKLLPGYTRVYMALVVDTPEETALSDIYASMTQNMENYFFRIFSTEEAASHWLGMCE